MLSDLTLDDLSLLEHHRLKRFRSLFGKLLTACALELRAGETLILHCLQPGVVDRLLREIDRLSTCAGIVLGVRFLSLYFAQEELLTVETIHQSTASPSAMS